ncbi:MAG: DUF1836 domain-containing protein [Lachnospiraceae bacterium]|nr:DUF1836 domain-containing protein [Lachnospiraceae bacterium]
MTELERILETMLNEVNKSDGIALEEIPGIDLYMDQLTTFMDDHLRERSRYPKSDKILTKTMINNYAKNDLLPPPIRKKYSKDHLLLLIFIYYLKSILSISDINTLIAPLKERFHVSDTEDVNLSKIYETMQRLILEDRETLINGLTKKAQITKDAFPELDEAEGEELRTLAFLVVTAYDVYMKKLLIEKTIDRLSAKRAPEGKKGKPAREKKRKD